MKIRYSRVYLLLYFVMAFSVFIDFAGGFPFSSLLRRMKYVYIAATPLLMLGNSKKLEFNNISGIVVSFLFFAHTVLWGYFFVNYKVIEATHLHAEEMLFYLLIVVLTYLAVTKFRIFDKFINMSFLALALTLLWSLVRFPTDIRHPVFWLGALGFGDAGRWKSTFGFIDANICGYYCMALIVVSLFIIDRFRREGKFKILSKKMLPILLIDAIVMMMLLSTGSRSNILSVFILLVLYVYTHSDIISRRNAANLKLVFRILAVIAAVAVCVLLAYGLADYIWENSNRDENITINFSVFKYMNAWVTGMGYVENDLFATDAFGYDTWNIDMYYQYIFFSTGICGIAVISAALLIILVMLIKKRKTPLGLLTLEVYISMLFNAYWQVNICTYRFYPSLILMSILLYVISVNDEKDIVIKESAAVGIERQ